MNEDFIQIQSLQGELKMSHKYRNIGMTVSTQELVIQKPHTNYHISVDQIVSIVPIDGQSLQGVNFVRREDNREEFADPLAGLPYYKMHVKESVLHNRSGIHPLQAMDFIVPIHPEFLTMLARCGKMKPIQ